MILNEKIKQLRQEKGWTQSELAQKLGILQKQVSSYENDVFNPSTEILIKMAEVFDVSLDYLAFSIPGKNGIQIKDRELLKFFEEIDSFNDDERDTVKKILELIVNKKRIQQLAS